MTDQGPAVATVLITTRDRKDLLRRALDSVLAQTAPVEILVMDDASGDGTADMVRTAYPSVRVVSSGCSAGCPIRRNEGFRLARAPIVVCLDDDAYLPSADTIAQIVQGFDEPSVGVVTLPYINVRRERFVRQAAPADGVWIAGVFAGGASAFRREAFLAVGGYADFREHGEETDLALRLLAAGILVRLGRAEPAIHDEAQVVKSTRSVEASARNHLIGVWRNVPLPYLPSRLCVVAAKALVVGVRGGQGAAAARGVRSGLGACVSARASRRPVPRRIYRLSRRLHRSGPLRLTEIEPLLRRGA